MTNAPTVDAPEAAAPVLPTYVFSPEEPFLQVFLGGRTLKFRSGRIVTTHLNPGGQRTPITEDDLRWFRSQPNRFVVWTGDLSDPMQRMVAEGLLSLRVTETCSRKAAASDMNKVMADVKMTLAQMLAADDGLPDIRSAGDQSVLERIARVLPDQRPMADMVAQATGQTQAAAEAAAVEADAATIAQAAAQAGDPDALSAGPTGPGGDGLDNIPDFSEIGAPTAEQRGEVPTAPTPPTTAAEPPNPFAPPSN